MGDRNVHEGLSSHYFIPSVSVTIFIDRIITKKLK